MSYFRKEVERHPVARKTRLTFGEARRITRVLCSEEGVPLAKVGRLPSIRGRRFGDARGTREGITIRYRPVVYLDGPRDGVTLLTVAHEVAHAIDYMERPVARVRHCGAHARIVDRLVARCLDRMYHVAPPPQARMGAV